MKSSRFKGLRELLVRPKLFISAKKFLYTYTQTYTYTYTLYTLIPIRNDFETDFKNQLNLQGFPTRALGSF
jgi:hypothetical protein